MNRNEEKGRLIALLPIGIFLLIFLGVGWLTGDFYRMPAIVGFLIALVVAFCQNPKLSFADKIQVISKGVGNENIVTMCLIFLSAGAFSGAVTRAGGMESTVNLGLSILPAGVAVAGLFLGGCFISLSMGTSMGTIAALTPIAVGISEKTGFSMAICVGAVVCGAMFGDNLSMISDTTIAAVKTQGCEMKDKYKANFFIVLPAAVLTLLFFVAITWGKNYVLPGEHPYQVIRVLPYLGVLAGALLGFNVFLVLLFGTAFSLVVGVGTGAFAVSEIFTVIGEGVAGMYDITVISLIVACIVSLVREYGGIQCIIQFIKRRIRGKKGAEMGIAALAALVDLCTANNTVAIVIAGPIAKEISDVYEISPKRSASLLDIFTSVCQGLIPYGAQLLSASSLSGLTPFEIMPYLVYPVLMGISALLFILLRKNDKKPVQSG